MQPPHSNVIVTFVWRSSNSKPTLHLRKQPTIRNVKNFNLMNHQWSCHRRHIVSLRCIMLTNVATPWPSYPPLLDGTRKCHRHDWRQHREGQSTLSAFPKSLESHSASELHPDHHPGLTSPATWEVLPASGITSSSIQDVYVWTSLHCHGLWFMIMWLNSECIIWHIIYKQIRYQQPR